MKIGRFNFAWMFGVARESRLATQNCFAILWTNGGKI